MAKKNTKEELKGPQIHSSQKENDERTKNIEVGNGTENIIINKNDILDTSAGDLILDLTSKDEEKTIEGVLNLSEKERRMRNNVTVSFRIDQNDWEWMKQVYRELS